MACLVNLDAAPQVGTTLQSLARNYRRLDVVARARCDPASCCHAWPHPGVLDDADDHPGALVPCSQDILGLSGIGYGTRLRPGAGGGVIGGPLGPRFVARIGAQSSVFLDPTVMAVPFVIIALTSNPYGMGFALLSEMITAQLWNVVPVSHCQRLSPDDLLGRVDFLYRFFGWGLMAVAALAGAGSSRLSHALWEQKWPCACPISSSQRDQSASFSTASPACAFRAERRPTPP